MSQSHHLWVNPACDEKMKLLQQPTGNTIQLQSKVRRMRSYQKDLAQPPKYALTAIPTHQGKKSLFEECNVYRSIVVKDCLQSTLKLGSEHKRISIARILFLCILCNCFCDGTSTSEMIFKILFTDGTFSVMQSFDWWTILWLLQSLHPDQDAKRRCLQC